jgi:hypothetical protein
MNICKELFLKFVNEFITFYNESLPFKIFNIIYLITTVITISLGTFTLIDGKNFASWGWIIFTIGCLLLMLIGIFIIIFCLGECAIIVDKSIIVETTKESNKINVKHITSGAQKTKKKILTSERIDVVVEK